MRQSASVDIYIYRERESGGYGNLSRRKGGHRRAALTASRGGVACDNDRLTAGQATGRGGAELLHALHTASLSPSQLTDVAPSAGNPETSKVRSSVNGTGQNIASHASPTANNYFLLLSTFPLNPFPSAPVFVQPRCSLRPLGSKTGSHLSQQQ